METHAKGLWGEITATIRDKAGRLCGKAEGRLLDVGCGNGLFFSRLGDQRNLRLFGLDRSRELLSEARETVDPLRLIRGVMGGLPFRDGSFDWVVCLNTFLNLPDTDEVEHALRELMRICKPGGRVIVDIRNRANPYMRLKYWWHGIWSDFPVRAYTLSQFADVFREEGFEIERVVSIGPGWSRKARKKEKGKRKKSPFPPFCLLPFAFCPGFLALAYLIQARRRK